MLLYDLRHDLIWAHNDMCYWNHLWDKRILFLLRIHVNNFNLVNGLVENYFGNLNDSTARTLRFRLNYFLTFWQLGKSSFALQPGKILRYFDHKRHEKLLPISILLHLCLLWHRILNIQVINKLYLTDDGHLQEDHIAELTLGNSGYLRISSRLNSTRL